ncbi:hypothetical protein COCNU_scaffold023106G000020 [Cocos nucifera]|nr:hypothetical protein [Cocos nucifera]
MLVRETAARQLEERRANWAYSRPVVVLDIAWNLAFAAVFVAVLGAITRERPNTPVRIWALGANAILAVSLAVCKAVARVKNIPLYQHIANLVGNKNLVLPVPALNVINGGSHAGNKLAMQEFMILPVGASSFKEAMKMGVQVYHHLKAVIKKKYGQDATNVGDEGGFAPNIQENKEGLELLKTAIAKAGYTGKNNDGLQKISGDSLKDLYKSFVSEYPIVSIEDPFDQDDWTHHAKLTEEIGQQVQIVGDDLLVTNATRVAKAINEKTCNALLLKLLRIEEELGTAALYAGAKFSAPVEPY